MANKIPLLKGQSRTRINGVMRAKPRGLKKDQFKLGDKNYSTLHPTKGWRVFSYARIKAGQVMAYLLGAR